jgi:xanthine dehydrogenase YagT iron-sulfur-binding subunit
MKRDDSKPSGFSRRKFLKGAASGAAASSALATLPGLAQEGAANATRQGLTRYAADGVGAVLKVNGVEKAVQFSPQTTLLQALRESLELTGAKEVCDRGACGACTVLIDGRSVNSCMMLALDAVGCEVTTVEGLKKGDELDAVQKAFVEHDACQCGYCIPGFVVRSRALLDERKGEDLDREAIKHGLCGNICRCAAYTRILDAVEAAAKGGAS